MIRQMRSKMIEGPWAVAAMHRPRLTGRCGCSRRVPMLYGTRRGSIPALPLRVSALTWEVVSRNGALDGPAERGEGDSHLRAISNSSRPGEQNPATAGSASSAADSVLPEHPSVGKLCA